jgi:hypothetical protein
MKSPLLPNKYCTYLRLRVHGYFYP